MPAPITKATTASQPKPRSSRPITERRGGSGCRYRAIGPKNGGTAEWPLPFSPAACPIPRFSVVRIRERSAPPKRLVTEDSSASGGGGDPYNVRSLFRLVAEI